MSKLLLAISASILALATAAEADHKRWHCQWKPEHARWGTSPCERGGGNARSVSPSQQGKRGGSDKGGGNAPDGPPDLGGGPDTGNGGNPCGGNCGIGLGNGGGNGTGNEGGGVGPGDNGNQPDENPGRGTGRGRDD